MLPYIERILDAARSAPSRDNLQPWRFVVEGSTISFHVDSARDLSPMNAGDRMARIAVGAAIECALLRAARMGSVAKVETPRRGALVTLTISAPKRIAEPDKALLRRATNRKPYDGRPVDDETFAALRDATPPIDSVRTHWFGRERVLRVAPLVEEGETLYYTSPRVRAAALDAMRFDMRDREEVPSGISLGSLELSGPERITIDALRKMPQDRLAATGAFKKMGARARRLVESSSGVCIVTARGDHSSNDVLVGRCMQRAWIALTRRGLVAHPMSAIPSLEAMLDAGEEAGFDGEDAPRAATITAAFRAAFPSVERGSRIAIFLRFGWSTAPASRVGRRALEESVAVAESGRVLALAGVG